jgi:hypothetical protein
MSHNAYHPELPPIFADSLDREPVPSPLFALGSETDGREHAVSLHKVAADDRAGASGTNRLTPG